MAFVSMSSTGSSSSLSSSFIADGYGFNDVEIFREQRLGSGAYGVVCRAKCDQLPCAAKLLHPTFLGNWAAEKFLQECSFLASLKHPHIVQFLGVYTDPSSGQPALLLELMDENLTSLLERQHSISPSLPLHLLIGISHDVALALHYLHSNGIIHRDLSSNNVLLMGRHRAKISDFGMSKLSPQSSPRSSLTQVPGCPVYMPPEAWLTPPLYTEKLDVFSLGVLMVQMMTCHYPDPGVMEVLVKDERSPTGFMKLPVSELERRSDHIDRIPSDHPLKEMVIQCLNDRAEVRPTSVDVCQILEAMKTSAQYNEKMSEDRAIERIDLAVHSLEEKEEEKFKEKELELQIMRDKISHLEGEIKSLQEQLTEKDVVIEELKEERQKLREEQQIKQKETTSTTGRFTLSSLSPEVLQVISSNRDSRVFGLAYKVEQGSVVFHQPGFEGIQHSAQIFLQIYQHFFNSGELRVEFLPVPATFPVQQLARCLNTLSYRSEDSWYEFMETPKVVKVVSKSPLIHKANVKLLSDNLNLRKDLGDGRTLTLKQGNIVDEDVSIIVSSANGSLHHTWGVSAAINVASHFEVQKHCDEYTAKHGAVEVGHIAFTKAGGSLKCSWIIHAIGPAGLYRNEREVDNDVIKCMKQLIHRVLQRAEKLDAQSIAIPAISTGSISLVASVAARGILDGIQTYQFSSSSRLMDIRLVVLKDSIFHEFVECFVTLNSKESSLKCPLVKQKTPHKPVPSSHQAMIESCRHQ